jgi:mono/diheme cytochrome c family protein
MSSSAPGASPSLKAAALAAGAHMSRFARNVTWLAALVISTLGCAVVAGPAEQAAPLVGSPVVTYVDQGWSAADRDAFYTTSQGSLMIPYAWFKALRRLDVDEPFAGSDQLQRYGYLRNDNSKNNPEGLPVGFVITGNAASGHLGMTCAACHTAQLEYQKDGITHVMRLDGAPANADFQQFLADLTAAARATLMQPDRFNAFAKAVLRGGYTAPEVAQLRIDFGAWAKQFGDFMDASLPASPWGPGRVDAFGMIINRVAGRDLGIPSNFKIANAPVSYPFLWNASRQNRTQWNGSFPNGLYIQALARNTGQVLGVFANFKPERIGPYIPPMPPTIWYANNSADFVALQSLEEKVVKLRPPPWPKAIFGFDETLARQGESLFQAHCKACHTSEQSSADVIGAWSTPVKAVGTDPKMEVNAERMVDPGILKGSLVPMLPIGGRLEDQSKALDVLAVSIVGTLINQAELDNAELQQNGVWRAIREDMAKIRPDQKIDLKKINQVHEFITANLKLLFQPQSPAVPGAAYEARALYGIWATAPYLHNGSVPNLWELLTPAKRRKATFMVGSRAFDPTNVGYVTDQSPFKNGIFVTDPDNTNGNGNGGHEFGTDLSEAERWAIIEYLKGL